MCYWKQKVENRAGASVSPVTAINFQIIYKI